MKNWVIVLLSLFLMTGCPDDPAKGGIGNGNADGGETPPKEDVAVTSVLLSESVLSLDVDQAAELKYTVQPEGAKVLSVEWTSDSDGITVENGIVTGVTGGASGTVKLTVTTIGEKTVEVSCSVTVANIPKIISRASTSYVLVKGYDFNTPEDGSNLQGKADIWDATAEFSGSIDGGVLSVSYPAGNVKLKGALAYIFEDAALSEADYVEIKGKVANSDLKTTLGVGLASGQNLQEGYQRCFFYTGASSTGTFGVQWGFRDMNGSTPDALRYSLQPDTWKLLGMSIGDVAGNLFFVADAGDKQTAGGAALAKGTSFALYFGMDSISQGAFPGNTVTIDYVAFYKLDENAVILPPGDTLKFFDEVKTGRVVDVANVEKDAEYDLLSGVDAFKTYYAEDFDGTVSELMQKTLPSGNKAWAEDRTWNVSSWEPAIKLQDSNLVLNIYKIDANDMNHKEIAGDTGRQGLIQGRADCVVGGINFGEMMLYGYAEARIRIPQHTYSGFWSGFYTYGTKPVSGKQEIGHEIDIFETVRDNEAHQILHFPKGDGRFGCSKVIYHYDWRNQFDSAGYIKAAVAWTPEKLVFYINDRVIQTITNTGDVANNLKSNLRANGYNENEIPAVPNIAQKIFLVIASNESMGYYGGSSDARDLQNEQSVPFIYYDNFKIYQYVGRIK